MDLEDLRGRITDVDSHVMLWPDTMADLLGDELGGQAWRQWAEQYRGELGLTATEEERQAGRQRARENIWTTKGWVALGAQDAGERCEVMDLMGISRQLTFHTGMNAAVLSRAVGPVMAACRRYNDWALDFTRQAGDRVRAACILNTTEIAPALEEARRVIEAGARAIQLSCADPPAGKSPADEAWDPLWSMLAEANVVPMLHLGSQGLTNPEAPFPSFLQKQWGDTPNLRPTPLPGGDPAEAVGPFDIVNLYLGPQVFLTAMVLGGVFERHPSLRFGVIELGSSWVSHWVAKMDGAAETFSKKLAGKLSDKPSGYVRRQVRVTPFYGEPVGQYIERDGLVEVYCFSTDYPHPEGGTEPMERFFQSVSPLGGDVVERFFVTNGLDLMPA